MNKRFPNIYRALASETMRPELSFAIVEEGKLIATNGNMLVVSDFSVFADNPDAAEAKVFDKNLLRWMAKTDIKRLECSETAIVACKSSGKKEEMPYSGYYKPGEKASRAIHLYPDETRRIGNFPDWKAVIPPDWQYVESEGIKQTGLDANILSITMDCFAFGTERSILKFEFLGTDKKSLIRITPLFERTDRLGKQCIYLMPK